MKLAAHNLSIDAPSGWEARIFARDEAAPSLHVATFPLRESDGDFGAAATGRMRPDDIFLALVQYRSDAIIKPGVGLFAEARPRALAASDFSAAQLQVTRPTQLGCQRFFTEDRRPFCIYAVLRPGSRSPAELTSALNAVVATIRAEPLVRAP